MRIGIDLGGTKTEGVILDGAGKELIRRRYPTPRAEGYEAILNTIGSLVAELDQFAGLQCTVGVCTPGAVSQVNGCLKNSNTVCMKLAVFLESFWGLESVQALSSTGPCSKDCITSPVSGVTMYWKPMARSATAAIKAV